MKKSGLIARIQNLLRSPPPPMPDNLFTPRAKRVLECANIASPPPTIKHVAIALLDLDEGVHFHVFRTIKIDLPSLRAAMEADTTQTSLSDALAIANEERREFFHIYLGTEHLLLAMVRCMPNVAKFLNDQGFDLAALRIEVMRELDPNFQPDDQTLRPPRA